MAAGMSARTYVWLVLALCAALIVPVACLNLLLGANSLRFDKNRLASDWQQATRGVTYAPPITHNRPFKTLRLNQRIGEINAVVFGSSTTMGLAGDALPPAFATYNFAQTGNPLGAMIGEAEYVVRRWEGRVKLLVIPLDWALGFVYERGAPPAMELTAEAARREAAAALPSLRARVADALSLPRLRVLMAISRDIAKAPDSGAAFRSYFLAPAGPEYRCADGTPARDSDVVSRGLCNGFRYDGSATFADQKRLEAARADATLASAASGSGQYAAALRKGGGEPNAILLDRLARLARDADARGMKLLLLLPPLAPGMQEALARTAHSGAWLRSTLDRLHAWAKRERITLLDAGRSERYGCTMDEFIDPHHALPQCYRRVFAGWQPPTAAAR
jgi:hypothetical protein